MTEPRSLGVAERNGSSSPALHWLVMDREKVALTGTQETMLATLYGRALDSHSPNSVLNDGAAANAVERIDYDFGKTRMKGTNAVSVAIRAKVLDTWTTSFLAEHPSATVLHMACGLDTRVQRLNPSASVRWFDVDLPEVTDLRSRLLPRPSGTITRSVRRSPTPSGSLQCPTIGRQWRCSKVCRCTSPNRKARA
jgi:O-methyltransferase involved in polyketide biosynthesis